METVESCYNQIVEYFNLPGAELSKSENGGCHYRHPDDERACAVGCLLTDEEFKVIDEHDQSGSYVRGLAGRDILPVHFLNPAVLTFLAFAQSAHDEADDVPSFLKALDRVYRKAQAAT